MKMIQFRLFCICISVFFVMGINISCSSAPQRAMVVTTVYKSAVTELEAARSALVRGDITGADTHLKSAYTKGVSVDNADVIEQVCLSRVTYELLANSTVQGAAKAFSWIKQGELFSSRCADPELSRNVCSLYRIHVSCISEERGMSADPAAADSEAALSDMVIELASLEQKLRGSPYYLAFAWRTNGESLRLQKKYEESAAAFVKAAELNTENRYLSEIGTDWYAAARSYSLGGQKEKSLNALNNALTYDRLAENTAAIAADYYAFALVRTKGSCTEADRMQAASDADYSASVYTAGGMIELAEQSSRYAAVLRSQK